MEEYIYPFKCPMCGAINSTIDRFCNCCHVTYILVSVGREKCDIIIDNVSVSKHHLDIIYTQRHSTSYYTIINCGINGTIVGGWKLKTGESITFPDDEIVPNVLVASNENVILDWKFVKMRIEQKMHSHIGIPRHLPQCAPSHIPIPRASRTPIILKVLAVPIAIIAAPISIAASGINSIVDAIKERKRQAKQHGTSYRPSYNTFDADLTYSSIYAPAEVKPKSRMQIQVYLHLYAETEIVKSLAQESDKNAERRDYIPLQCKLKKGDKVDVQLNIYGESLLVSDKKSVVWQGSFTKCSFDYFVPKDIDVDELSCMALLSVNGIPVGEMRFITKIVESPRQLNPEIIAHKYNKVFISYAHKDEAKVNSFHEGLKLAGIEHFFDRTYLKTGDIFPQVIRDYINSADLFVLFWSENASKSEYVDKERKQALERAFPQVKPQQEAKLSIYPMSIEPRAELPSDMKDNYHFGEI